MRQVTGPFGPPLFAIMVCRGTVAFVGPDINHLFIATTCSALGYLTGIHQPGFYYTIPSFHRGSCL